MITCDTPDTRSLPLWAWAAKRTKEGGRGSTTPSLDPPRTGPLRNGNPRGNPNAAPRCGAKNRAGLPCRAPAMANGRCHLHGGKCTGPRTPEGLARMAAAHTRHGYTTAPSRIRQRYIRTLIRRCKLKCDARFLFDYLPPEMAARLGEGSPELWTPIHPSNQPYVSPPKPLQGKPAPHATHPPHPPGTPTRFLSRALAAERQAAQAEAAAQAPWRQAIAHARAAKRAATAAKREAKAARRATKAANRAASPPTTRRKAGPPRPTTPPAPTTQEDQLSLLERELAARKAGLRTRPNDPPHRPSTPTPNPDFSSPRINPMDHEQPEKQHSASPGINPMDREPSAAPARKRPMPTRTLALGSTTLANTWQSDLHTDLAKNFGHQPPPGRPSGWPNG